MRVALIFALLALILAGRAEANVPSDHAIERAQAIAAHRFHEPCDGHVAIRFRVLPGPTLGRASKRWPPVRCTVTLDRSARWTWGRLCSVVGHEYGHLAGRRHVAGRGRLMYPVLVRIWWRCRR